MSTLLRFLPALACAGVMFVCMRGMFGARGSTGTTEPSDEEIARLRSEVQDLRHRLEATDAEAPPGARQG